MPRLDQSAIREIHSRIDIATFIGQYVSLKKRGRDFVGLCPFHGEKTPSFHVHPDQRLFQVLWMRRRRRRDHFLP